MNDLDSREQAIVDAVKACRFMQSSHIERLCFSDQVDPDTSRRNCQRTLTRLATAGWLKRLDRQVGGRRPGSTSYVYSLGPTAVKQLLGRRGPRFIADPSTLFLEHTLSIAEIYVQLHESARQEIIKLLEIETEPSCWRTFSDYSLGLTTLKPDLFVRLQRGNIELLWFIEIDRGTSYANALNTKLRTYKQYYFTGSEQEHYEVFPRVLWVVPNKARLSY